MEILQIYFNLLTLTLNFDVVELAIEFFKLENFADEEVTVAVRHLRIGDMDHVVVNVEVKLKNKLVSQKS